MVNKIFYREVEEAADLLKQGKIIIFPTDTVYGIGGDILNESAVQKIFLVKGRDFRKPLATHVANWEQIEMVAETDNPYFYKLFDVFLPGPLAVILPKKSLVPNLVTSGLSTVSIRFPNCFEAIELARLLGRPLAATSANPSGLSSPIDEEEINPNLAKEVSFVIKRGTTLYKKESTIVDLSYEKPIIRRIGAIPIEKIEKVLGLKIDFI
ncbi:MAG: L-threonylcarbamoyladenylate synthase [Candidatus Kapaibacteriales bacterium]